MTLTLNLPKDLESQLTELSRQRGESLETIAHTALLYYTVVFKKIMDDLDQQKSVSRQKRLENIHRLRGLFKGGLSTSEEFAARKASEKELEL
jgi:hypothetical protein